MTEWYGAIVIIAATVGAGMVFGWAWGVFVYCALIAVLWGIALVIPTEQLWSRRNGQRIFRGALICSALLGIIAYLVHGLPWAK